MKRQTIDLDKTLAKFISDKGHVLGIYKELLQLNKKTNNPSKMVKMNSNRNFTAEDTWIVNMHMKRCLTALVIREKQIKIHWDTISQELKWL